MAPFAPWNSASGEQLYLGRVGIPRGELSFVRFPKPKFNGNFLICLVKIRPEKFEEIDMELEPRKYIYVCLYI